MSLLLRLLRTQLNANFSVSSEQGTAWTSYLNSVIYVKSFLYFFRIGETGVAFVL